MKLFLNTTTRCCALVLLPLTFSVNALAAESAGQDAIDTHVTEYQFNTLHIPQTDASHTNLKVGSKEQISLPSRVEKAQLQYVTENEYWIYDSWVTLDTDLDYDGYYSSFTLEFDADTVFASAPVYAVVYLGNEDYYESIHVTSPFSINSDDSSDSFVLESTLISGFPAYDYDLLIELYDAQSNQLVAATDAYDDADLAYVSLESNNYEYTYEDPVVVVHEHGGSTGWIGLLVLGATVLLRRTVSKPSTSKASYFYHKVL